MFISSSSIALDADYGFSSKGGASTKNLISMDFQDANLKTVLKIFSQQSGLNFVASQNVKSRTVTIYFDNVTVEDALNHIMSANRLVYEQEPGSNIFIVRESGAPVVETMTKIYELKFAQLTPPPSDGGGASSQEAEILTVIGGVLSENGKILADKRSNSLIIKDVPSQFSIIEDVISRVDIRTPQVMIEAEILETTTTVADQLGMNWSGQFGVYAGPTHSTVWPLRGRFSKDTSTGEGITEAGSVNFGGMGATLSAVLSNSDTKILARPRILTLNNETAVIKLTAETAVASVTSTTNTGDADTSVTSVGAERINTGITLEVTPQINKDGYITMRIEPTVIVPVVSKFFAGGADSKFVDPQTRSAETTVMVSDGETVIIGGLISKEDTLTFEKIPFLGDIPLLGLAFRYKTKDEADKELIIFITPHIVEETPKLLGKIFEREQEKSKAVKDKEINYLLDLLGE